MIDFIRGLLGRKPKHEICHCELSGDLHLIECGRGCELCTGGSAFTPKNVQEALRFLNDRANKGLVPFKSDDWTPKFVRSLAEIQRESAEEAKSNNPYSHCVAAATADALAFYAEALERHQ